jgi:hypothetical protein
MVWLRRGSAWGAVAVLAGCAAPASAPTPVAAPEAPVERTIESQPLKHLANRHLQPLPDRPLSVATKCSFRDPTGYRGRLDLQVKNDDVRRFRASVTIPKHGECSFDLKDFRQSEHHPIALADAGGDSCVVRLWEQKGRVTVAFRDCRAQCGGETSDYLWPILVDARTGKCS